MSWLLKATLVAIALAALAVWAWGRPGGGWIGLSHFGSETQRFESGGVVVWHQSGRIGIGQWGDRYSDGWLIDGRLDAEAHGLGWRWTHGQGRPGWVGVDWEDSRRPLRWELRAWKRRGIEAVRRVVSAPCWLVAVVAGAWPATSAALMVRRAIRRRWAAMAGCCRVCGYDLRESPERCPECGSVSSVGMVERTN